MDKINNNYVIELDLNHVFHSWSVQKDLNPIPIAGGLGSYLWDFDGKKYLDFSSQLINTNIGHQHPKIIKAIIEQANILTTIAPSHANLTRAKAASSILKHAPSYFKKVFFTNGGADAIENAIRMARIYSSKHKILSGYRSYHGNTGLQLLQQEIGEGYLMNTQQGMFIFLLLMFIEANLMQKMIVKKHQEH